MTTTLQQFLRTYLFLIPLVVMFLSEGMKILTEAIRTRTWHAGIFQPGGLPSSHSALVTSLLIVVGHKIGPESPEFAIAFVFAAIVWYDAIAIRREVGAQAMVLNKLQHWQHFTEQIGHSLAEVICGIAFGAAVTMIGIAVSK